MPPALTRLEREVERVARDLYRATCARLSIRGNETTDWMVFEDDARNALRKAEGRVGYGA